jgi:hypothetical protein
MRFFRFAAFGRLAYFFRSAESTMATALRLLIPAAIITTLLALFSWKAGHQAGELEDQRLSAEITNLGQRLAATQLELQRQQKRTTALENALNSSGKSSPVHELLQLRQELLKAQAELNQYKSITEREQRVLTDGDYLLQALTNPDARLLAMKRTEQAADAIAYALLVEKTRVLFIGSKLPKLTEGKQYQLWLVRKQEPKLVSAGVFTPNDDSRALVNFDDPSLLTELASLVVTDEPEGGSTEPTGTHLLEAEVEKTSDRVY